MKQYQIRFPTLFCDWLVEDYMLRPLSSVPAKTAVNTSSKRDLIFGGSDQTAIRATQFSSMAISEEETRLKGVRIPTQCVNSTSTGHRVFATWFIYKKGLE